MLNKITKENEIQRVLEYIEEDIANCLYIYIDLKRYGLNNKNVRVWVDRDGQAICLVIMKYHDGFQIYSRSRQDAWDRKGLIALIQRYKPERISGNESVIRVLESIFFHEYQSVYGVIFKVGNEQVPEIPEEKFPETANHADIPEIAELLLTEREFQEQYTKEELVNQLEERYETKMGRSMIIRDRGKIVGHIGTFAETEDVAIISGSVTAREYRNTDYYAILSGGLSDILCNVEKKNAYFFITNKRFIRLLQKANEICGKYGKLIKKEI